MDRATPVAQELLEPFEDELFADRIVDSRNTAMARGSLDVLKQSRELPPVKHWLHRRARPRSTFIQNESSS
jgi:hypothetical protein